MKGREKKMRRREDDSEKDGMRGRVGEDKREREGEGEGVG